MIVKKGDTVQIKWTLPANDPGTTYSSSNVAIIRTTPDGSCQELVPDIIVNSDVNNDGYISLNVDTTQKGVYKCVLSSIISFGDQDSFGPIDTTMFTAVETDTVIETVLPVQEDVVA